LHKSFLEKAMMKHFLFLWSESLEWIKNENSKGTNKFVRTIIGSLALRLQTILRKRREVQRFRKDSALYLFIFEHIFEGLSSKLECAVIGHTTFTEKPNQSARFDWKHKSKDLKVKVSHKEIDWYTSEIRRHKDWSNLKKEEQIIF
jgi:high-affinity Fe2+/Pb2+ permease